MANKKRKRPINEKNQKKKKTSALNAENIINLVQDVPHFSGIFTDKMLKYINIIKYPITIIVNINNHWLTMYLSEKEIEIYDTLCGIFSKEYKNIHQFISNHMQNKKLYILPVVQPDDSNICGYYSAYFAIEKSQNNSFKSILCHFNSDLINNDFYINQYFQ